MDFLIGAAQGIFAVVTGASVGWFVAWAINKKGGWA